MILSWLRVFRSPNAAHLGHEGGQGWQRRGVPSEKCVARRGSMSDEMCMITPSVTRALQRESSRIYIHFLPIFQEVKPISETRNKFSIRGRCLWIGMIYGAVPMSKTNVGVGGVWPRAPSPWGLEASWSCSWAVCSWASTLCKYSVCSRVGGEGRPRMLRLDHRPMTQRLI